MQVQFVEFDRRRERYTIQLTHHDATLRYTATQLSTAKTFAVIAIETSEDGYAENRKTLDRLDEFCCDISNRVHHPANANATSIANLNDDYTTEH